MLKKCMGTLALATALMGSAQASLVDRGGGMIYDTTLNITWMSDLNYAKTSAYTGTGVHADGSMTWTAASTWASDLIYGGSDDWRLATIAELGKLFALSSNLALFTDVQSSGYYWSGTEYAPDPSKAWLWITFFGFSGTGDKGSSNQRYVLAVADGDVAAITTNDVPEPQTLALALLALGATAVARRKRPV